MALARLAPEQSGSIAVRLASETDPRLRVAACRALSAARQSGTAAALALLSADPDPDVRRAAYLGLGQLGEAAVAPLAAALTSRSGDPGEVEAIVQALGATGAPSSLPLLSPLLGGALAPAAASAIGRLGAPAGVPVLLAALQGGGAIGSLEIVEGLAALGSVDAGEALSAELLSDRPTVRAAAARAVGRLRYEPASPRLEALRSDYDAEVRRAAREALARLPVRAAPEALTTTDGVRQGRTAIKASTSCGMGGSPRSAAEPVSCSVPMPDVSAAADASAPVAGSLGGRSGRRSSSRRRWCPGSRRPSA